MKMKEANPAIGDVIVSGAKHHYYLVEEKLDCGWRVQTIIASSHIIEVGYVMSVGPNTHGILCVIPAKLGRLLI